MLLAGLLVRAELNGDDFDVVWRQVSKFNLYDPLALLAATPGAGEHLFQKDVVPSALGDVQIINDDSVVDSD